MKTKQSSLIITFYLLNLMLSTSPLIIPQVFFVSSPGISIAVYAFLTFISIKCVYYLIESLIVQQQFLAPITLNCNGVDIAFLPEKAESTAIETRSFT